MIATPNKIKHAFSYLKSCCRLLECPKVLPSKIFNSVSVLTPGPH